MEEMCGVRHEGETGKGLLYPLQVHHPTSTSTCSPTQRFNHAGMINQSIAIGSRTESPNHRVGSSGNKPPFSRVTLLAKTQEWMKGFTISNRWPSYTYWEIPRVLGTLCQEPGTKTKYIFLTLSQYHIGISCFIFSRWYLLELGLSAKL